jgi:hypothetical protein
MPDIALEDLRKKQSREAVTQGLPRQGLCNQGLVSRGFWAGFGRLMIWSGRLLPAVGERVFVERDG